MIFRYPNILPGDENHLSKQDLGKMVIKCLEWKAVLWIVRAIIGFLMLTR